MAETGWPDEVVVGAAQRGDLVALSALVSGSRPHVHRFAHSLCASPEDAEDAEDAAQEALIVLYRKVGTLRASRALASWLFRIVSNECMRRSRLMLRTVMHAPADDGRSVASSEDEALQRLEADQIAHAIAGLPDDQRRVLVMRDVQGHSGRTVAGTLGLSVPAMKSRLHRARASVRGALAATDVDDG